jgi:hypothetical protein
MLSCKNHKSASNVSSFSLSHIVSANESALCQLLAWLLPVPWGLFLWKMVHQSNCGWRHLHIALHQYLQDFYSDSDYTCNQVPHLDLENHGSCPCGISSQIQVCRSEAPRRVVCVPVFNLLSKTHRSSRPSKVKQQRCFQLHFY